MKVADKFALTADTTTTQEFRCPQCGTTTTHRNWDKDVSKMKYQCSGCGQIFALDYKEVYYLRTKKPGAYTHNEKGETIFLGYDKYQEDPAVPKEPGKSIYETVPNLDELVKEKEDSKKDDQSPDSSDSSDTGHTDSSESDLDGE